jgi:hypothetical protein
MNQDTFFLTTTAEDTDSKVILLVESLRDFGGEMADSLFGIFTAIPRLPRGLENERTHIFPLKVPPPVMKYPFGMKVAACAQAEQLVPAGVCTLIWIDPSCLVVKPPVLFELGSEFDAAFRPVHIRNIGLSPSEPLDAFWQGIYAALGVNDITTTVTSFIDGQCLRTYINSHAFSVNPALGLMHQWYELFQRLITDQHFQNAACSDERHQIFLFQSILSALVATSLEPRRMRILPPTYNYPYNLHERAPIDRRAVALDNLVCFTYEDRSIHPSALTDIKLSQPLRAWLESRLDYS